MSSSAASRDRFPSLTEGVGWENAVRADRRDGCVRPAGIVVGVAGEPDRSGSVRRAMASAGLNVFLGQPQEMTSLIAALISGFVKRYGVADDHASPCAPRCAEGCDKHRVSALDEDVGDHFKVERLKVFWEAVCKLAGRLVAPDAGLDLNGSDGDRGGTRPALLLAPSV